MPNIKEPPVAKERRPITAVFSDISEKLSRLIRQEIRLAQAETTERISQVLRNSTYLVGGAVIMYTGALAFTAAAILGLAVFIPAWSAALLISLLLLGAGALIAKIGLETLRDFKYEHAEMKCRFYGREGNGVIRFSGPTGSRNFDIRVYDHRWRTEDGPRISVSGGE